MTWDWNYTAQIIPTILQGVPSTVLSTLYASVIGLIIGLLLAIAEYRRVPAVGLIARGFIGLIRNTPLIVQLYLAFFGLPFIGITLDPFTCGYVVLGLFTAAYMAGVYRAGIEAVPEEQWEACRALNLPTSRVWFRIIIPQALPPIIPGLGNYVNAAFKLTAYLTVIGVMGILGYALQVGQLSYRYFEPLTIVGLAYLVISILATIVLRLLESVVNRSRSTWRPA
jgi:polar amino acid transport system permease protein